MKAKEFIQEGAIGQYVARSAIRAAPTLAKTAWEANPKIAREFAKLSPPIRNEFLVRFPTPATMERTMDDIYQQAMRLHNSGNRVAAKSLMDAHDNLSMMLTTGPSDQLMLAFKNALKNQT